AAAAVSVDGGNAAELIALLRQIGIGGPILALSRNGSVKNAVETIRAGADDFVVKPYQAADVVRRLIAKIDEPTSIPLVRAKAGTQRWIPAYAGMSGKQDARQFYNFVGTSPAMLSLYAQIERVAPSKAPVFVTGESGTGKEVCAEAVHTCSPRAGGPFIALNCSAIPRELMESEIFGHVKGAFTGAYEDRPGAAELAHGGTLFLDEICEMDLALQAKLLRFAQTGTVRRVGDTRLRSVDVRFICATNREPAREIEAGRFREDLFYRLHVLPLQLPALRDRGEDILRLARAFLLAFAEEEGRRFVGFTAEAEAAVAAHPWPGNVRELQNVIRRVVVLHDGEEVRADMLALGSKHEAARDTGPLPRVDSPSIDPFWRQEQRIIEAALKAFDGNTHKAALALEIAPSTIYRKLQAWGLGRGAT
ncbi:MAG TPA: sigma-54 dependent transcriptional regulator, partial [Xanthobacteraceae bacterium]|nr:sigma-54 dependent transcriptional regulator [Xanthobacteraceae bacterium]